MSVWLPELVTTTAAPLPIHEDDDPVEESNDNDEDLENEIVDETTTTSTPIAKFNKIFKRNN
jgi:hypothetical protein